MSEWRVPGFTELKVLGEGAQGRAVLVREKVSGRVAVLKYSATAGPNALESFRTESTLLKQISSAHIAQWYGHYESPAGDHAAILMEAVDGASLRTCLSSYGPLPAEAALLVLKGSLLGLAAAHAQGIIHRDFKPANIVVCGDGASKLIDFGIATLAGQDASASGTPAYMAPEQWHRQPPTPAMDVYAATCVFYECLTGQGPHPQGDPEGTAPIPAQEVAEPLRPLIRTGLAKDPAERPSSASEFVDLLERAATAAYGPDWELAAIGGLSAAAATLTALFPLTSLGLSTGASATAGASASGTTSLGQTAARTTDTTRTTESIRGVHTMRTARRAASLGAKAGTVKTVVAVTAAVGLTAGTAGTVAYVRHHGGTKRPAAASPLAAASPRTISITTSHLGGVNTSFLIDQLRVSGSAHDAQINAELAAFANRLADVTNSGGQITSLPAGFQNDVVTAKVRRPGPKLISIAYTVSASGVGSADGGGSSCAAENISVATGAELKLRDLFTIVGDQAGADRLASVLLGQGKATGWDGSPVSLSGVSASTLIQFLISPDSATADGCPAFTKDNLEIAYSSGTIGAMYQGPVTVAVPLAQVREFLQPITQ